MNDEARDAAAAGGTEPGEEAPSRRRPAPGLDELRGDEWRRLLAAARRRLGKTGGEVTGSVSLAYPSDEESRVVTRVTGRRESSRRPVVSLRELDAALRGAYGAGLCRALAWLDGPGRPEDVRSALTAALRCRYADEGWFTGWLGALTRDGTVGRLVRQGRGDLPGWAAAVLDRLPARDIPLPVLAEWATGDATALSGTPLASLVMRALVLWQGAPPPAGREDERRIWRDAGVVPDDLTSQVLVLGLRAREEHTVARWLDDAAAAGMPFRLTLQQLMAAPVTPRDPQIFVCESPVVVRAAAELGAAGALVCTEGRLSAACDRLLRAAAGARIHWRNDFDWPGVRMTAAATERYAAVPWRMGAGDYADALAAGRREPLKGSRTTTPWDPRLADAMTRERRAAREEWLLPALLSDLRSSDH
ncbi:TIGR02679 family protein [Actinoallomurus sp. NBC_01490]|uniref:TIGR02679 family protein n=1 Tax=Actinoallomurus sp. NBC_01490 TaxID=2903557 RepID=UPI002E35E325|nr:TIGR02679 family protein [Actinoallomurus sp. NBC_01490]